MNVRTQFESTIATRLHSFRKMARRLTHNSEDAEDVVQDAMLLAHQKLAQFRGESQMATWLGTIVINVARMRRRGIMRHRLLPEAEINFFAQLADNSPNPHDQVYAHFRQLWLENEITKLPTVLRRTIRLRLADCSDKEMAAHLRCPVGTAKARLSRAKVKLAERVRKADA